MIHHIYHNNFPIIIAARGEVGPWVDDGTMAVDLAIYARFLLLFLRLQRSGGCTTRRNIPTIPFSKQSFKHLLENVHNVSADFA